MTTLRTVEEVAALTGLTPEGVRARAAGSNLPGHRLITEAFVATGGGSTIYSLHEVAAATGLTVEGVRARAGASTVPGYRLVHEAYLPFELDQARAANRAAGWGDQPR